MHICGGNCLNGFLLEGATGDLCQSRPNQDFKRYHSGDGIAGQTKKRDALQSAVGERFAWPHIDAPKVDIAELVHDDLDQIGGADGYTGGANQQVGVDLQRAAIEGADGIKRVLSDWQADGYAARLV